MKAAELFVRTLENEGVEYVFGIPGEENLDVMDALLDSSIQFITTRHEQGAAFMADVYGRLTGRAGVCMATLGPGATNLITGVADANMDHAPLVAIAGQASTNRLHKESHQVLNLEAMFLPITKYSTRIVSPEVIPEIVRKAFKVAQTEKTGACFIEFPENIAEMEIDDAPLRVKHATPPEPAAEYIERAAELISNAENPIILAGNGVIRANAAKALTEFAEKLGIPVANTFMAKGVIPFGHPMSLGSVGLQSNDYVNTGFANADVIICIGYDMVEYHPYLWHPSRDRTLIHIDTTHAEVDGYYSVVLGVVGNITHSLNRIAALTSPHEGKAMRTLRDSLITEMNQHRRDTEFPVKPQKIIWDLRTAMHLEDIVICDVGAHKMWMSRMFRCEYPNTCIISNGFASMGIAVPGAIAAKLAHPERKVVAVTGDAGFLMNSQEIETAMRLNIAIVILIWNDASYGLIEWKQQNQFGRTSNVKFGNPDFVQYAQSFGATGVRVNKTEDLITVLKEALDSNTVTVIDCPVDYRENLKLTESLGQLTQQTER
ncbi:acetolactate synthase large subunit [Methylophaga sp. UBA2689]|jgi:acetolactate synthase-1/2/3 large subunit|uniref:acetolactate synthase large subunit n=1 Tax=Methylophaga sp. UBA2689 TaxID=1946878 RepID=UPI0025CCA4D3|nr:acetolactate synthase large subunit [Methylophaga sp. UBA2689]|tara:strand:+ start:132 stop:1769 length:1638 start_codon:yes stop_codon:yes gene_type:complete